VTQVAIERTAEDPSGVDGEPGPDPNAVTLVAFTPDGTAERTWTFAASERSLPSSEASFPSWAWR